MLKHYVEFLYPGAQLIETSVREVQIRDPSTIQASKECFGYRFFDRQEITLENEKHKPETLKGEPKNYSGIYYFGKTMTLEEIKREIPNARHLINNMERNKGNKFVKTRGGTFHPFTIDDVILSEK